VGPRRKGSLSHERPELYPRDPLVVQAPVSRGIIQGYLQFSGGAGEARTRKRPLKFLDSIDVICLELDRCWSHRHINPDRTYRVFPVTRACSMELCLAVPPLRASARQLSEYHFLLFLDPEELSYRLLPSPRRCPTIVWYEIQKARFAVGCSKQCSISGFLEAGVRYDL
jgi:hypothetical protein